MKHIDYEEINARIRAAERMRSDALGKLLESAGIRLWRWIAKQIARLVAAERRRVGRLASAPPYRQVPVRPARYSRRRLTM